MHFPGIKSSSPNSSLVRNVIDLKYANKKRADAFKWMLLNVMLLALFAYDLWGMCPGHWTSAHCVEGVLAVGALASATLHAWRLLPTRCSHPSTTAALATPERRVAAPAFDGDVWPVAAALRWRTPSSPPSPPSPRASSSTPPSPPTWSADAVIADPASLAAYLRAHSRRLESTGVELESEARAWSPHAGVPPLYQLASLENESGAPEEGSPRVPAPWRRLHLDPQRLAQWNLNLRLWLHLTILERLVREMDTVDATLTAEGAEARVGAASVERLRALAGSSSGAAASVRALLPFLEPFTDQRYVVQRIRELARGGCLGAYKWCGGGEGWTEERPTDADLMLHLFAAYIDAQAPGGGRAFSGAHLSSAPAPLPRGPRALAVHRVRPRPHPPHFVLVLGEDALEVGAGRNNLLHTLLLLVAALASLDPPALRLQLGRAGLNLLWVIER